MHVRQALAIAKGTDGEDMTKPIAEACVVLAAQCGDMFRLLLECRDALPAISIVAAKLHNVSLTLDKRIERAIEPWRVTADTEGKQP